MDDQMPRGLDSDAGQEQGEKPNVSPQEQAQYDQFMNNGFSIIYDPKTFPTIVQRIRNAVDPAEGLAAVVAMVVTFLEKSALEQKVTLSPDVLFQGGIALGEDLAEILEKAGIHKFSEKELESATYRAMDIYRQHAANTGALDAKQIQQDWSSLVQANNDGTLDKMMPGLKDAMQPPERPAGRRGLMPQEEG